MLSVKIQNALNTQVGLEDYASHYYLSMASWCDKEGYFGSAKFLYAHSEEEKGHMMKMFKYVIDAGAHALVQPVPKVPHTFKSLLQLFEIVLKHEKEVTQSISSIVELALKEKDFATFNFLQWFVAEQHEEEKLFNTIIGTIKMAGTDSRGLFFADKEIEKLIANK